MPFSTLMLLRLPPSLATLLTDVLRDAELDGVMEERKEPIMMDLL
jgi:hypothetical protein